MGDEKYPGEENEAAISTGLGRSGWCIGSYLIGRLDEEGDGGTESSFKSMLIDRLLLVGDGPGSFEE